MHVTGIAEKRMLRCGSHKRVGQELFITSHGGVSQSTLTLLGLIHFFKKYAAQNRHVETSQCHKKSTAINKVIIDGTIFFGRLYAWHVNDTAVAGDDPDHQCQASVKGSHEDYRMIFG